MCVRCLEFGLGRNVFCICGGFQTEKQSHYEHVFAPLSCWTVVSILMDTLGIDFWTERGIAMHIVFTNSNSILWSPIFSLLSTFVDPRTGEHTNGIENCWSLMKKNLRRFYPIKNDSWLLIYLYAYQFRFNFLNHHSKLDLFEKIIDLTG